MEFVSRQVRRQRERLAKKGRTDAAPAKSLIAPKYFPRSKYMPHVGKKQIAKALFRASI